jgi:ribosomal protein S21
MANTNVEVEKNSNENNLSILRRFTKRVQGSGVLNRIRGIRYYERNQSTYSRKKIALKRLRAREANDLGIKLGKIKPVDRTSRK